MAKITFDSGNAYEGDVVDGKPDGRGKKIYSYWTYEGDWKNGMRHGEGTVKWPDGDFYKGQWKDDSMHGQGIYKWTDGNSYEGEWKDGKRHGKGIYKRPDGSVKYDGEWKNGKYKYTTHSLNAMRKSHSFCCTTYLHPASLLGANNTIKMAKITFDNGGVYEGDVVDGKPHGRGKKISLSGNEYEGKWKNGMRHGKGVVNKANGYAYEGEYKDDKRNGKGITKYPDGSVCYDGEFRDGFADGNGTLNYESGNVYTGEWRAGKRHDKGVMTYADKSVYDARINVTGRDRSHYQTGTLSEESGSKAAMQLTPF
ncbi:phosphatidylinositol-4-phosphate 5-kinase-related protein [Skeletonema marinoi]|uniref:Phosphatidylinositol-4-phosphate 5-kinase-related protein n=1 Tax=Skeletonema marinoi TaxID=267567 RepID=A0AAD9D8A1_9STRA|nr:phosphatidylinositol-4-phosphate 5-kinase-related protein [Skeletonema marinoi]